MVGGLEGERDMARSFYEVADEIRADVLRRRYPANVLPSERTLAHNAKCGRQTVRLALCFLQCEGVVVNVRGGRWELTDSDREATFSSFLGFINVVPPEFRAPYVRDLIHFRRREFVNGVDARLLQGAKVTKEARRLFEELRPLTRAESVLREEDELMTQLMVGGDSLVEHLAAHQLRRALAGVRQMLNLDFCLYPNVPGFMELFAAWDLGDRPKTLQLADRVATEREALYFRLLNDAVLPAPDDEKAPAVTH